MAFDPTLFCLMPLCAMVKSGLLVHRIIVAIVFLELHSSDGNFAEDPSSMLLIQFTNCKETALGLLQFEDEGNVIPRFGSFISTN
jgi:hypothetical protein